MLYQYEDKLSCKFQMIEILNSQNKNYPDHHKKKFVVFHRQQRNKYTHVNYYKHKEMVVQLANYEVV